MEVSTHHGIVKRLCGEPIEVEPRRAVVRLETTGEMVADAQGLIHGGFIFGAADYAAMVAVNDPNVVLGSAEVRFAAPVRVQQVVDFEARLVGSEGRKHTVEVEGRVDIKAECREGDLEDYFLYDYEVLKEPDTVRVALTVVAVTNLYDSGSGERLWTIQSTCFEKATMHEVLSDEAEAIANQLRYDRLIG